MTTIALTSARKPSRAIRRQHPLLSILAWEARRWQARRNTSLGALIVFGCFFLLTWSTHTGGGTLLLENGQSFDFTIAKTSVYGLRSSAHLRKRAALSLSLVKIAIRQPG